MTTRRYSTGQLTDQERKKQNARYDEGHTYDYLFIGSGMSALSCASLLAESGAKVCLLEAHDTHGGYAHTFEMEGYRFCAQVHYIWGCQEGGTINKWLKRIGLDRQVTFELYDPSGYDRISLPDGNVAKIAYGFENVVKNISSLYPSEEAKVRRFYAVIEKLFEEMNALPEKITFFSMATTFPKFLTLFQYRNKTLQDLFDECGLAKETQAILSGNAGDFNAPPKELSLIVYTALVSGYNQGAFYPTKHFKYFLDSVVEKILAHKGCHIYYETEVEGIDCEGDRIKSVRTSCGKNFTAGTIISNMDPKQAAKMIGSNHFQEAKRLDYSYSPSSFMIYLGLKDINLLDYGFGKHNTWHLEDFSMNDMWERALKGDYEKPWFFISTPTLHTSDKSQTPPGREIMEVGTMADFSYFSDLKKNPSSYRKAKRELEQKLFSLIDQRFIPGFSKYIDFKVSGSPTTNLDFCYAPRGNAYGSHMIPSQVGLNRLKEETPFRNFFFCNASSGYAGVYGTVNTGVYLYQKLTKDVVF